MNLKQMLFAAMIAAVLPMQANAATATTNINVSLVLIAPTGTVSVGAPINFGSTLNTKPLTIKKQTNLTVNVTKGIPYNITINCGLNPYTLTNVRKLVSVSRFSVFYQIFKDLARTQVWGDGSVTFTDPGVSGVGKGLDEVFTVYASANIAANRPAGNYTDTLAVTLTY